MHQPQDRLLPADEDGTIFCGYLEALGRQYRISIAAPKPGENAVDLSTLVCDPEMVELFKAHNLLPTLRARLAQARDVGTLMSELENILERVLRSSAEPAPPPADYYAKLVAEIDAIGWSHLVSMGDSMLTSLQLRCADTTGRDHVLSVQLPPSYPSRPPVCSVDLPRPLELRWSPGRSSLADVLSQFREALPQYLPLWEVLDDLDAHTWVLEPERPTRCCTMRRVAVAPHCSLMVQLDPAAPRAMPELRFLGSENAVDPLRQRFHDNIGAWDPTELLRLNLQNTLGVQFPSPATTKREDFSADCGICYAYRLLPADAKADASSKAGAIPDRICDNPKCRRPYHPQCILEWLQALPTSRVSFDTIFGQCPYCSEPISVKIIR